MGLEQANFSYWLEVFVNKKRRKWSYCLDYANTFADWFESRGHNVEIRERFEVFVFGVFVNGNRRTWSYRLNYANAFADWFESRGHNVEIREHKHTESKTYVGPIEERSTLMWSIYQAQERNEDLAPRFFFTLKERHEEF